MSYNPDLHHRRSIRLKGYDYAQAGAYFVNIIVRHRICLFGDGINREMRLNAPGEMVEWLWQEIPQRFPGWDLDAFVIMPNHIHGIIVKNALGNESSGGAGLVPALAPPNANNVGDPQGQPQGIGPTIRKPAMILGDVVGGFKSITTHQYIQGVRKLGWPGFDKHLWQPDYYEQIIRDEAELNIKREYIANNPFNWDTDQENPDL